MTRKQIVLAISCLVLLATASMVQAHDLWLEKRGDKAFLFYGHPGNTDSYPLSKISSLSGITANQWEVPLQPMQYKASGFAWLTDEFVMLTASFDNQYWFSTEEDGWRNFATPQEVRGTILEEGKALKYTKNIVEWRDFMKKPVGMRAEIVPLKDPTRLKEGDTLPVMLYYEGKPVPVKGAQIVEGTDINVEHPTPVDLKNQKPFRVKIGPAGRQMVVAHYAHQLDTNKYVWYAFSLTFTTTK